MLPALYIRLLLFSGVRQHQHGPPLLLLLLLRLCLRLLLFRWLLQHQHRPPLLLAAVAAAPPPNATAWLFSVADRNLILYLSARGNQSFAIARVLQIQNRAAIPKGGRDAYEAQQIPLIRQELTNIAAFGYTPARLTALRTTLGGCGCVRTLGRERVDVGLAADGWIDKG